MARFGHYDVVVLGGAVAGASTALLIRRRHPGLRVLVVEKNPEFDWKVGESTVEVSSYFLSHVLRLYDHLSREQLTKQGLRYWFHNGGVKSLREASEVGPGQLVRLPGFQVDRARLDEHVLAQAVAEGAELWRPARVAELALAEETGEETTRLRIERGRESIEVRAGHLVDASGRSAILARRMGTLKPLEEHPTSAVWARFRDVVDLDGVEVSGVDPADRFGITISSRRLATNHFTGWGYWMWFIPLKGGETSIGAVWDTRMVSPAGETPEEKLRWFLEGNPLTRSLLRRARLVPGDLRAYAQLPYLVDRVAGHGWSLVGDAAGFLDPFYSPGLDQVAYSASWTLELLRWRLEGLPREEWDRRLATHNASYYRYLRNYFETVYRDKYAIMGDYDTMTPAFLLDTALYYFFVVWPVYSGRSSSLLEPPFYHPNSRFAFPLIRFYQRRLVGIAGRKLLRGTYGDRNAGRRPRFMGYSLGLGALSMFFRGLVYWGEAEARDLFQRLIHAAPLAEGMPGPMSANGRARPVAPEEPSPARLP